ncbi:thrombospondin-1-like [Mercenaria mercenaria]|uniref:thrombospondin-1-like n=1 Tax=Mercenaria mercenaria TaxID=6596 RepID=UPI00234EA3A3|nr:thrombospondin-1-like [Mercenaria mercenaria]
MYKTEFLSVILGLLLNVTDVSALQCFNCSNISDPSACNTTIMCNSDEACYQDSVISGQSKTITLGCIHIKQCGVTTSGPGTLIGRDVSRRQNNQCHECCSTDRCNELLCARRNPADCIDDETIDCSRMNSVFGICKDISHAKALCPHFCGLCDVVDGVWTEWTPWSTCDVTCETGTQSRARTCTNPATAHGGLDCIGDKAQTKQCHKQLCPVHGGWSAWKAWGTCSVTCGIGIQRRQRTCTNPAPQRFGDHCFGLSLDDRLCMSIACSNGGWTAWRSWGSCSITCGGGFRSRSRTCTNPITSLSGKHCKGDTIQVGACSNTVCKGPNVAFRSKDSRIPGKLSYSRQPH